MAQNTEDLSKSTVDYFRTDDLKLDLKQRAIRSGGIAVFSRSANYFFQLICSVILARLLSPDEFGLVAMVTAITGFLIIFTDFGLTDATIQKTDINHKQISTIFWINVIGSGAVVLVIIALSPLVAWFYDEPRLKMITVIWSSSLFFAALSTQHIALLKRRMLFLKISIIEMIGVILSNVAAIILAMYGWSYWALVGRIVMLSIFVTLGAWLLCGWQPRLPAVRSGIRSMLEFGKNTSGFFIVNYFSRNLDKILIGWRFNAKELGFYHYAFYLFLLPTTQLTTSLRNVAVATLSRLRNDPEKYHYYYLNAIIILSFIGMPVSAFFVIISNDLILFLLGPQWAKTAEIFSILGAGAGVQIIYSTHYWIHTSLGRADRMLRWGGFELLVTGTAIFLGLPFGAVGVAVAYTLTLYLLIGPAITYAGKSIDLKFCAILSAIWRHFTAAVCAGILCWCILNIFHFTDILLVRLILSFLVYVSLYLISIVVLYQSIEPITHFISINAEMFLRPSSSKVES